jgi:hypothetical protein
VSAPLHGLVRARSERKAELRAAAAPARDAEQAVRRSRRAADRWGDARIVDQPELYTKALRAACEAVVAIRAREASTCTA